MLNKGVLALNVPVVGLRGRFMLTKTLEWNLRWCVLDSMFDEKLFRVRDAFVNDPAALQLRFKCAEPPPWPPSNPLLHYSLSFSIQYKGGDLSSMHVDSWKGCGNRVIERYKPNIGCEQCKEQQGGPL